MTVAVEIFAAVDTLLVGIPESVAVLAIGAGLIIAAVSVRRFLKREEKTGNNAVKGLLERR